MMKHTTEFRVGKVFGRACLVFARHFFKFVIVTGIGSLSWLLFHRDTLITLHLPPLPMLLVAVISTILSQAVVILGAFQDLRGRPMSLSGGLRVSLRNFPTLVGLMIWFPLIFPGSPGANIGVVSVMAVPLLFAWSVAVPACVIEELGPIDSLVRCYDLTKSHRLKVLGVIVATVVASALIMRAGGFAIGAGLALAFGSTATSLPALVVMIALVWIAIWTAFLAVLFAVIYYDLSLVKEGKGIETDRIAGVFD